MEVMLIGNRPLAETEIEKREINFSGSETIHCNRKGRGSDDVEFSSKALNGCWNVDVWDVLELYVATLREEQLSNRSIMENQVSVMKVDFEKMIKTMKKRMKKVRSSYILQGAIEVASGIITAVSGGVGSGVVGGAGAVAGRGAKALSVEAGKAVAGRILKEGSKKVIANSLKRMSIPLGKAVMRAVGKADPFSYQAQMLEVKTADQQHRARVNERYYEMFREHCAELKQTEKRVFDIMSRYSSLDSEARKVASGGLRV